MVSKMLGKYKGVWISLLMVFIASTVVYVNYEYKKKQRKEYEAIVIKANKQLDELNKESATKVSYKAN